MLKGVCAPKHMTTIYDPAPYFSNIQFKLSSHLCLNLPNTLDLPDFQQKPSTHYSSLPYVLHAPFLSSLIMQYTRFTKAFCRVYSDQLQFV